MMRADQGRIVVNEAMTFASARQLLEEGSGHVAQADNEVCFDLANVREVDSSGLAVVFGWQRAAQRLGRSIRILNPPANLQSLAQVYGVGDWLPG